MTAIARWILAALGTAAACAAAWTLLTARVSAAEARLDTHDREIQALREDSRVTREDTRRMGWMLFRICETVGAHPCVPPPERP